MDDDSNENGGLVAWVIGLAVTLAICVAVLAGTAAFQSGPDSTASTSATTATTATATTSAQAATSATSATTAQAATSAAGTFVAAPGSAAAAPLLARVLFDTGVSALPGDVAKTLAPAIEAANRSAGIRLAVSGYHDKTGDPEKNAELAKERAIAVRDALVAAGVPLVRLELSKPQMTEGGTDDTLARRVDVTGE
jgi:cytochrome c oxidase subunit 2